MERKAHWYVVHTYTGSEEKVKKNLEQRIRSFDVEDKVFQIVIPTEPEIVLREGQRVTVDRKALPGYILVQMIMDNQTWNVVRNTPGVTGFISSEEGDGKLVPSPIPDQEVEAILQRRERAVPRVKVGFSKGENVRITSGPFTDFAGVIDEVYPEKRRVKVLISFLGRETPVELDILEVQRL